jgi:hypothetical protein
MDNNDVYLNIYTYVCFWPVTQKNIVYISIFIYMNIDGTNSSFIPSISKITVCLFITFALDQDSVYLDNRMSCKLSSIATCQKETGHDKATHSLKITSTM